MREEDGQAGPEKVLLYYAFVPEGTDARTMSRAAWRMTVQAAAAEYGISPDRLVRSEGPHGKPFFRDLPGIHFNISHSGRCIACAFSGAEVGLDVQVRTDRPTERIARRILPHEQYEAYLAAADREDFFYTRWVELESYLKRRGDGFTVDLKQAVPEGVFSFPRIGEGYYAAVSTARPHSLLLRPVEWSALPEETAGI